MLLPCWIWQQQQQKDKPKQAEDKLVPHGHGQAAACLGKAAPMWARAAEPTQGGWRDPHTPLCWVTAQWPAQQAASRPSQLSTACQPCSLGKSVWQAKDTALAMQKMFSRTAGHQTDQRLNFFLFLQSWEKSKHNSKKIHALSSTYMVILEKIHLVLEIIYCLKWALALLWNMSWQSSPLERRTQSCTMFHLEIIHAGSYLLKRVRKHMYTIVITKGVLVRERKTQSRRKYTKKTQTPGKLWAFSPFSLQQKAENPSPIPLQSCQKRKPNSHGIYENFTLQGHTKWIWWQQNPAKKQETRWLWETLVATCRLPSTATAWWQPGSLQRHKVQSPALTLFSCVCSQVSVTGGQNCLRGSSGRCTSPAQTFGAAALSALAGLGMPYGKALALWPSRAAEKNGTRLSIMVSAPHLSGLSLTDSTGNEKKFRSWNH